MLSVDISKFVSTIIDIVHLTASRSSSSARMLRRVALPLVSRAGQRLASRTAPEKQLDISESDNPNFTKFEVVDDPDVWSYVERLIPDKYVPPMPAQGGPSGWTPVRLTREEVSEEENISLPSKLVPDTVP